MSVINNMMVMNESAVTDGILHLMRGQGKDKNGFAIWICPLCPNSASPRLYPRPSILHKHIEANHGAQLKLVKKAAYLTAFWLPSHGKLVARLSGMRQNKDENPKQLKFSAKRKAPADSPTQQEAGKAETASLTSGAARDGQKASAADHFAEAAAEGARLANGNSAPFGRTTRFAQQRETSSKIPDAVLQVDGVIDGHCCFPSINSPAACQYLQRIHSQ